MIMITVTEKIEELKSNYKRFTGLELHDDDILHVTKLIRAEKAAKFIRDNIPLYPHILGIIEYLELKEATTTKGKKNAK